MSFTPRTGGHSPREPGEPGKVLIGRPVLGNVSFSERDLLKLVSMGVFEKLNVNPSAPDQCVVPAGERQSAVNVVDVRPERQLVSTRPAQYQSGGAGVPLLRHGNTRLTGLVCSGIKQENKGNILYYEPLQLFHQQPQALLACHCCLARTWKASANAN